MKNLALPVVLLLLVFTSYKSYSTHFLGGEISYKCLGGMDYLVSMVAYGDCQAVPLQSSFTVQATATGCAASFATTLPLLDTALIPNGCSSWTSACAGGTFPGSYAYLYQDTITLPVNCSNWVFSAHSCCRYSTISNLVNPGSADIYVETMLNSIDAPCNNSPVFQQAPLMFICTGEDYCISNSAYDQDGDSLVFSIAPSYQNSGTPIPYAVPFSTSNPFSSSIGHMFDPITGNHCFNPPTIGSFAVAYRVDEYRGGVLIGSVHRDFAMNVVNCIGTSMSIVGAVSDTAGNPILAGEVVLYEYGISPMSNPVVDTVIIGPGGTYGFHGLPFGQYIAKAVPDTASYPGLVPSYHEGTYYWQYADPVASICDDTLTADIVAVHQSNMAGSGYIEGYLGDLGLRSSFGDPWAGQEVFLETWPGYEHVATVRTDSLGIYRFENVPDGSYRIIVDRPGNPMTGYYTVMINGATSHTGLDYAGDPVGIHPFISTGLQSGEISTMLVQPNPVDVGTPILLSGLSDGQHFIRLFDMNGREVLDRTVYAVSGITRLDMGELATGTYSIVSDQGYFSRVVIH